MLVPACSKGGQTWSLLWWSHGYLGWQHRPHPHNTKRSDIEECKKASSRQWLRLLSEDEKFALQEGKETSFRQREKQPWGNWERPDMLREWPEAQGKYGGEGEKDTTQVVDWEAGWTCRTLGGSRDRPCPLGSFRTIMMAAAWRMTGGLSNWRLE